MIVVKMFAAKTCKIELVKIKGLSTSGQPMRTLDWVGQADSPATAQARVMVAMPIIMAIIMTINIDIVSTAAVKAK
jgi:hypothetical protein